MPGSAQAQAAYTAVNRTDTVLCSNPDAWTSYAYGSWAIPAGYNSIINVTAILNCYAHPNNYSHQQTIVDRNNISSFLNNTTNTASNSYGYNDTVVVSLAANNTSVTWDVRGIGVWVYSEVYYQNIKSLSITVYYV